MRGSDPVGAPGEARLQSAEARDLHVSLQRRSARIGVMGLGYVGLPLALAFLDRGFRVLGFEVDPLRVGLIQEGCSYVGDVSDAQVLRSQRDGRFEVTSDMARLGEPDAICICVPTPLRKTRDPDMSFVTDAISQIEATLRSGQLVVLESTSYPGTTEEMLVPMAASRGLRVGLDVFVASSPERIDPANPSWNVCNTPKVVGGATPACTELAAVLYRTITGEVVQVSRPMAAELTKLFENTFRAVNIGLANEMALICRQLGVDTWEVIEAAATKPFGFMPFFPGPGIGGHCVPVDPLYLSWKLRANKVQSRFIDLADDINRSMPEYVVERIMRLLNNVGRPVRGSRILLLGVAYKRDVSDVRESPAVDILARLAHLGADVVYHDPHVPHIAVGSLKADSRPLTVEELQSSELVVVLTDHERFDADWLVEHAPRIFDTRNLTRDHRALHVERL